MGQEKWWEFWLKLSLFEWLVMVLIGVGVILLGMGVWQSFKSDGVEVEYLAGEAGDKEGGRGIMVDVEGAVINPGVYELAGGSRVKDALVAAGGLSEEADREFMAKMLNLAKELVDGEKIYVPRQAGSGEGLESQTQKGSLTQAEVAISSLVNINTASKEELDSLWGVGEARAQAIIDGRPYATVMELLERKILPENVFEKNKDKLTVY